MELLETPTHTNPVVLVAHAEAAPTPRRRLRPARAVVEGAWTVAYAGAVFQVADPTTERPGGALRAAGPAG